MTEKEYILATDSRSIDLALDALRHVIPENNPHVKRGEFNIVVKALQRWQIETRAALDVQ